MGHQSLSKNAGEKAHQTKGKGLIIQVKDL